MSDPESTFDFEYEGRKFRASVYRADDIGPPWAHSDGYGVVTGWEARNKRPHELVLNTDHGTSRYYDLEASRAKAEKEGWGLNDDSRAELVKLLGRGPTQKEVLARAVLLDYENLKAWCEDDWWYVGIAVQGLDDDGNTLGDQYAHALWGIESTEEAYQKTVAEELAADWLHSAPPIEKLRPFVKPEDKDLPVLDLARLVFERVKGGA